MIDRKNVDVSEERKILSHMIMSTPFLNQLKGIAESKFFKASYSQIVVKWIWEFFEFTGPHVEMNEEDPVKRLVRRRGVLRKVQRRFLL